MEIRIIEVLNEIAQNEHENFRAFREKLTGYCIREKVTFSLLRFLLNIEIELKDCLKGRTKVNADRAIIKKVHKIVKSELFIIRIKLERPKLIECSELAKSKPDVAWTDDKLDLIEIIKAVFLTKSMNHGIITGNKLQKFFEDAFHIQLGNIYNRIGELEIRKEQKNLYLEKLLANLKEFFDDRNA